MLHTNRRLAHHKTTPKQCHINTQGKVYDHGYQKFLQYLWLKLADIPEYVQHQYKLQKKVTNEEWVYVKIGKGMYGLPQAGLMAQEQWKKGLQNMRTHRANLPTNYGHITQD